MNLHTKAKQRDLCLFLLVCKSDNFSQMRSGIIVRESRDLPAPPLTTFTLHLWIETKLQHYNSNWLLLKWNRELVGSKHTNAGYSSSYSFALESIPWGHSAECRGMSLFVCGFLFLLRWNNWIATCLYTDLVALNNHSLLSIMSWCDAALLVKS